MGESDALPKEYLQLKLKEPRNVLFWTGAGTSKDSGLPLGNDLTECILHELFSFDPDRLPFDLLAELKWIYKLFGKKVFPRLEFVMDAIRSANDFNVVPELMRVFDAYEPSEMHKYLASMCSEGAQVVTANFDTLLEKANAAKESVFHYHGTWDDKDIGVTLSSIGGGFSREKERALLTRLQTCDYVIFVGFSGSDFYDVEPFFEEHKGRFGEAIWIKHNRGPNAVRWGRDNEVDFVPSSYRSAFSSFKMIEGHTNDLFNVSSKPSEFDWHKRVKSVFKGISSYEKQALTIDFFRWLVHFARRDRFSIFIKYFQKRKKRRTNTNNYGWRKQRLSFFSVLVITRKCEKFCGNLKEPRTMFRRTSGRNTLLVLQSSVCRRSTFLLPSFGQETRNEESGV